MQVKMSPSACNDVKTIEIRISDSFIKKTRLSFESRRRSYQQNIDILWRFRCLCMQRCRFWMIFGGTGRQYMRC